ncbi:Coiled-coil domain-containing protein 93 [Eumeta japonica]|uniref:Coiled-coil domain-containing protein 93 n=1 Tax=Eumeta variegata TaxID=151549 RepID=A0A4C1U0M3_EUMVA|nr:Coiled-coil domain-containing protein 93 [Eumeta japonica]
MGTKQKNIFNRSKPLINIYSGLDHDGKEIEVREDAEQIVKWHEIVDALVGAGYYRAQLQGLSAFDKIVGGLSWCIELCDIDVDVSLLFEENLTIGKKIALTEKIVKVLPSMQCPHSIEPHQIQGLDFINIYPLVQWLIKYSSEFRVAKEDELRKFAVSQFEKNHIFDIDREHFLREDKLLKNLLNVQNLYKPCRVRKRKKGLPSSELEQINSTLSEYDQRMLMHISPDKQNIEDEGLEFLYEYEKALADPSEAMTKTKRYDGIKIDEEVNCNMKLHYELLQSELTGDISKELEESEKIKYYLEIEKLNTLIDKLEKESMDTNMTQENRIRNVKEKYSTTVLKLQQLTHSIIKNPNKEYSDKEIKEFYKSLKELIKEKKELTQIVDHKEKQYEKLKEELKASQIDSTDVKEEPLSPSELKEFQQREEKLKCFISNLKLELAKINRETLRYTIAIDEVPGQAELLQYERRFIELYNQVASKHKETKQFYTFYNTLYEVKLYTSKELSLLNSILDNYEEAMSSPKKREQFMTQLESIVEWVKQTVKKVEQKYKDEKEKKAALNNEYSHLLDLQRQYAITLKKLTEERRRSVRSKNS